MQLLTKDSYPVLPIFDLLAKKGDIEEKMMYNTFNMGLGMVLAVDPADVDKTMEAIREDRRHSICGRTYRRRRKGSDLMLRLGVLVSGGGTNLQAIIDSN